MPVQARIAAIRQETPTVKAFTLELEGLGFEFLAGQWLDCYVEIDGRAEVGGYSMTSSPLQEGSIELAIKRGEEHPVTRYLHERAKVGERVQVEGGFGDFFFARGLADSLVLIAGGIGITPLMSMLRYVEEAAPEVTALLLYSARSPAELLFRQRLEEMARRNDRLRCLFTVTGPLAGSGTPWEGRIGRIDGVLLREAGADPAALYYLCGPSAMTDALVAETQRLGVPLSHIKFERWW